MTRQEGKQYVNGKMKNTVDVIILSEGRMQVKRHNVFYFITLNSMNFPMYSQTQDGEAVEICRTFVEDREFIQITIGDDEPIYCLPDDFCIELKDSIHQLA